MSNESSAIVRFITLAQKEQQTLGDSVAAMPDLTDDVRPLRRSYKVPLLVLGALLLVAVAGMVGVYIGKNYAAGPRRGPARAEAARPVPPASAPAAGQSTAVPLAAPAPSAAPVSLPPEVLAETGFDVRVKPHATVSLDGRVLGTAPLRVRSLTPGAHVLDIEAPPGYFSRRVELELDAGEPQNVNLALDPIHPVAVATAGADEPGDRAGDGREDRARRDRRRPHGRAERGRIGRTARRADMTAADRAIPASGGDNGTLMLGSKPPCDIYIDGAATGLKTPQRAIELAAGVHRVTLVNSELDIKKSFTVEIEAGKSTRAIHDLTGKI